MSAGDLEKRRRVMQRSMKLGHCVCNPRLPCPCDTLRQHDVCLCAGERLGQPAAQVRLTQRVEKAGCGSKIDQAALKRVLAGLPFSNDPRVLVGACAGDDAGVYRLDDGRALVQTVDVFSPSVDDPYAFGQVAAANSLSDIYAMGGQPLTALSIVGFPIREVADAVLHEILRGGLDKMAEAGVAVIGGHSIQDKEIKAGFAVTGLVDPARIVINAGIRPGDVLVLTKPIGTGILSFAGQIDRAAPAALAAATRSMAALNRASSEAMVACGAHACTDVTGFGLLGHLGEMARAAGVDVEIVFERIPLFDGVRELAAAGVVPGATERNRESSLDRVDAEDGLPPDALDICCDPQTSGGLLIAIEPARAEELLERLHAATVEAAATIGRAVDRGAGRVRIVTGGSPRASRAHAAASSPGTGATPSSRLTDRGIQAGAGPGGGRAGPESGSSQGASASPTRTTDTRGGRDMNQQGQEEACCSHSGADAPAAADGTGAGIAAIQAKFQEFLKAANAPGALDAATRQAIAIALSVLARCEPCTKAHVAKARKMGFSQDEIDEAAWMAIAFGGSPAMVFYNALKGQ